MEENVKLDTTTGETPETKQDTVSGAASAPPQAVDPDYAKYLEWKKQQDALRAAAAKDAAPEEFYVWLADGDVVRLKRDDFPVSLTVDHLGHYEKNGHAYRVVAVYPIEDKVG